MCIFAATIVMTMASEYNNEDTGIQNASEPSVVYEMDTEMKLFSEEELSHGIPLEESRRRITEMIYNHYHPQT